VTTFNRGRSPLPAPSGVRAVHGDREQGSDLRRLARSGTWDAVVDVAGSVPAVVRRSATILGDVVGHCVFVSTVSAYADWPHRPVNEASPLWPGSSDFDPGTRVWDPATYGPLKVGCELAWAESLGADRLLRVRSHVVLGRHEYVGRLVWWLNRVQRGGLILAPGPDRAIQPIDVRDLTSFLLDQAEVGSSGVFNVAAPMLRASYGTMLEACIEATARSAKRPATLVWIDEEWLGRSGLVQWTELPLWRKARAPWGMSTQKAQAAGLRCRPVAETVDDTWEWLAGGGVVVPHERHLQHGIGRSRERDLIDRWLSERGRQASQPHRP
jgi:2'-hydroxyisoflavone reductase